MEIGTGTSLVAPVPSLAATSDDAHLAHCRTSTPPPRSFTAQDQADCLRSLLRPSAAPTFVFIGHGSESGSLLNSPPPPEFATPVPTSLFTGSPGSSSTLAPDFSPSTFVSVGEEELLRRLSADELVLADIAEYAAPNPLPQAVEGTPLGHASSPLIATLHYPTSLTLIWSNHSIRCTSLLIFSTRSPVNCPSRLNTHCISGSFHVIFTKLGISPAVAALCSSHLATIQETAC